MGKMAASQSRGLQGPRSCGVPGLRGGAVPAPRSSVLASSLPAPGELQPEQTTTSARAQPQFPPAGTWQPPSPTVPPCEPLGSLNCLGLNIAGEGAAPASCDPGHGAVTQQSGHRRNGEAAPRRHLNTDTLCSVLTRGQRPPPCLPAAELTKTTTKPLCNQTLPVPRATAPARRSLAIAGVAAVSPHSRHVRRGRRSGSQSPAQRWDAAAPGAPPAWTHKGKHQLWDGVIPAPPFPLTAPGTQN